MQMKIYISLEYIRRMYNTIFITIAPIIMRSDA